MDEKKNDGNNAEAATIVEIIRYVWKNLKKNNNKKWQRDREKTELVRAV